MRSGEGRERGRVGAGAGEGGWESGDVGHFSRPCPTSPTSYVSAAPRLSLQAVPLRVPPSESIGLARELTMPSALPSRAGPAHLGDEAEQTQKPALFGCVRPQWPHRTGRVKQYREAAAARRRHRRRPQVGRPAAQLIEPDPGQALHPEREIEPECE